MLLGLRGKLNKNRLPFVDSASCRDQTTVKLFKIFSKHPYLNFIFICVLLAPSIGFSAPLFKKENSKTISESGPKIFKKSIRENRGRPVSVDLNVMSSNTMEIELELFSGVMVTAKKTMYEKKKGQSEIWSGFLYERHIDGANIIEEKVGTILITRRENNLRGTIHYQGSVYIIKPTKTGGHELVEINTAGFPEEHPEPSLNPSSSLAPSNEGPANPSNENMTGYDLLNIFGSTQSLDPIAPSVGELSNVRVLVAYTPNAELGSADIEGEIDLAVAETNASYANSGLGGDLAVELVGSVRYEYFENGNIFNDLNNFGSDPYIQGLRDQYSADVVILIAENSLYCGLANGIDVSAKDAYALVNPICLAAGVYSFAHEIGHLQGARHDFSNDPSILPYPYGHGYRDQANGFRTIMAYPCISGGVDLCPRIPYWSSPNNYYLGHVLGIENLANDSRVLSETAQKVAGFWTPSIPYNLIYQVDFDSDPVNAQPTVGSGINTPTAIAAGSPVVALNFGTLSGRPLLLNAAGESAPYNEGISFNVTSDVDRIEISFEMETQGLIGDIGATAEVNLGLDSSNPVLVFNDNGSLSYNGSNFGSYLDGNKLAVAIRLNFTSDTIEILVNQTLLHTESLTANALTNFQIGIQGSTNQTVAIDNLLVSSDGTPFSDIVADFDLDVNSGAWVNGFINYTAQFKNDGPHLAENFVATIEIPADVTLNSYDGGAAVCNYESNELVCSLDALAANSSLNIPITIATSNSTSKFPFAISAVSDSVDIRPNNNDKILLLGAEGIQADLAVSMTGSSKTVKGIITVNAKVTNNGPDVSDDVVLTLPTPSGALFQEVSDSTNCQVADENATRVLCNVGDMQPGETYEVTFKYWSFLFFAKYNFTASINNTTSDPNAANNGLSKVFGGSASLAFLVLLAFFSMVRHSNKNRYLLICSFKPTTGM